MKETGIPLQSMEASPLESLRIESQSHWRGSARLFQSTDTGSPLQWKEMSLLHSTGNGRMSRLRGNEKQFRLIGTGKMYPLMENGKLYPSMGSEMQCQSKEIEKQSRLRGTGSSQGTFRSRGRFPSSERSQPSLSTTGKDGDQMDLVQWCLF